MAGPRTEAAAAIRQQDRVAVRRIIGDHQVGGAIAVEVVGGSGHGIGAGRVTVGALEGAVAIAEQHGNRIRCSIDRDDIALSVVVEIDWDMGARVGTQDVARHDEHGVRPNGVVDRRCKRLPQTIGAAIDQDGDVVRPGVGGGQIVVTVAAEVSAGY